MRLEDEADHLGAVARRVVEVGEVVPVDEQASPVGHVERADEVQQGALAGARRPGERDQLARLDREGGVLERAHPAALERLADAVGDDGRTGAHECEVTA